VLAAAVAAPVQAASSTQEEHSEAPGAGSLTSPPALAMPKLPMTTPATSAATMMAAMFFVLTSYLRD